MTTRERTFSFLQAGTGDLEAYLLSDSLYWQLPGPATRQRLTPGGLLMGLIQLESMGEPTWQAGQIISIQARIDNVKLEHHSAWERKIHKEIAARLQLWKMYLEEYRLNPEEHGVYYSREVNWRVLLQLLLKESSEPNIQSEVLSALDKMVKSNWLPGEFLWEPYLVNAFQQPEFWFLYGKLKS
jgi:hypothetical protein